MGMKHEHRIYPMANMFGVMYNYEIIGETHHIVGQISAPHNTRIPIHKFRELRKEMVAIL
jgi:uncharacterized protein with HEPN domain